MRLRRYLSVALVLSSGVVLVGHARDLETHTIPRKLEASTDPTYGYTEENPVKVGLPGPKNAEVYLSRLKGPKGEKIKFERLGSCCPFKTPNALVGDAGLLDKYKLTYKGLKEPLILFVNGYDYDTPRIPTGLSD